MGRNIIQRFMILDGTPGGGKSQLAIVIQLLVGLLNCTQLRTEHLHERFELYRFLKKTLLTGVDVPADFLSTKGATVIKGLVGGDFLDAEQKNGTGCFPLEGTFCIVVTSNSRLQVRLEGDTGAWRRRLLIVRYEAPPPAKKIPDFGKSLVATEGPGILNWALQGLSALLHDVEKFGDIQLTSRQSGMVDSLLAESDSLRFFLRDCVMQSDTGDLTVSEIIQTYAEYCPTKGWNPLPITVIQRQVEALMLELFQTVKSHSVERDGKSQKGFHNVCFKK
jgi:phage/plasmid-associated DNA primase